VDLCPRLLEATSILNDAVFSRDVERDGGVMLVVESSGTSHEFGGRIFGGRSIAEGVGGSAGVVGEAY
jgi:hypothetical protein